MKTRLFPAILLAISLFTHSAFSAEDVSSPSLMPGRYVLIMNDNLYRIPVIVNVIKKEEDLLMSVENPEYADTAIRTQDGNVIFQLSRTFKAPQAANVKEDLFTFAGVNSVYTSGLIEGSFSCLTIFRKGINDNPTTPNVQSGTFMLFPIDKKN